MIDTEFISSNFPKIYAERKPIQGILSPDSIAEQYLMLHRQTRDAWTFELDLRPWVSKWWTWESQLWKALPTVCRALEFEANLPSARHFVLRREHWAAPPPPPPPPRPRPGTIQPEKYLMLFCMGVSWLARQDTTVSSLPCIALLGRWHQAY